MSDYRIESGEIVFPDPDDMPIHGLIGRSDLRIARAVGRDFRGPEFDS